MESASGIIPYSSVGLSPPEAGQNGDRHCVLWLQCLPEVVLEKIMHNLSYREVNRLGTLCRRFRLVASSVLRIAFRNLIPQIERGIDELEANAISRNNSSVPAMAAEERDVALRRIVLRLLLAEARILKATCWRYIRDGRAKNFCLPHGALLDEFSRVIADFRGRQAIKYIDSENLLSLLSRVQRFLDLFDNTIEPSLITYYTLEATPYGIKVINILDCYENSNYSVNVTHSSGKGQFCLSALYEHRYISTSDEPPFLSDDMTSEEKLRTIYSYLRNNVRWINMIKLLMEAWDLEVAADSKMSLDVQLENIREEQLPLNYECLDQQMNPSISQELSTFLDNLTVFGMSENEDVPPLEINLTGKSHIASASGNLDSEDGSILVKTDKVRGNKPASTVSKLKIIRDEFRWPLMIDEAGTRFDFKLQLTIQYPSSSENDVTMQTVIRVQQTSSTTVIATTNGFAPDH